MITRSCLSALTVALSTLAGAFGQSGSVPSQVSFQGFLTDPSDNPITGIVPMHFKIYRDSVTATHLWSESQTVDFVNGIFNVLLGKVAPLPDTMFSGQTLYLGIAVDTDPEMTPRQPLVSLPYAFLAGQSMCVPMPWYTDADSDGFGIAGADTTLSCTKPELFAPNVDDCDDTNPTINPGAVEVCDGVDNDCDGTAESGIDTDADAIDDLCDLDDDDDGIEDQFDDCPLEPGPIENNGCPL